MIKKFQKKILRKKKMVKPISGFKITTKRVNLTATGPAAVVYACGMVLVGILPLVGVISAFDWILRGNWNIHGEIHLQKSLSKDEKE